MADLEARGDLAGQRPHEMVIGRCQRSNDVIEPRLKTQWFIRTGPLAARALDATRSGRTRILPERFEKTWEHWLTNIRDWNVSRQLWWGHRIPAWYCPDGHVTVSAEVDGPAACDVCGRPAAELQQDPDIFDTWFSSGLWPFSTLGWPDDDARLATYYPTSVMETGYDIIFFWVARMMMLGIELTGTEPFHTVYLSGLIRDPLGQKMSKTKGNVVDPLGVDRRVRRRRPALRGHPRGDAGQRPAVRAGQARARPELRQQAVERHPVRDRGPAGYDPRGRRTSPARRAPPRPGRALAAVAGGGHDRRRPTRPSPATRSAS